MAKFKASLNIPSFSLQYLPKLTIACSSWRSFSGSCPATNLPSVHLSNSLSNYKKLPGKNPIKFPFYLCSRKITTGQNTKNKERQNIYVQNGDTILQRSAIKSRVNRNFRDISELSLIFATARSNYNLTKQTRHHSDIVRKN